MFKELFSSKEKDKVKEFSDLLIAKEINMNKDVNEKGNTIFSIDQRLECGPTVRFLVVFDKDVASVYMLNYVVLNQDSNEFEVLKVINQIHQEYIHTILYLHENEISLQYFIDLSSSYHPKTILDQIGMMINIGERIYPQIMKVVWS